MKKKNFVTLIMSVVGGLLFAMGMCMALLPEWDALIPGIAVGAVGAVILLVTVLVRRKMDGKPAIKWNGRAAAATLLGIFGTAVFGAGMCMVTVWDMLVWGTVVGIAGIILLICLIPVCKGLK